MLQAVEPIRNVRSYQQTAWTQERVERLKALKAEGLSCAEIGRDLGVSRNAVIGKLSRLGLSIGREFNKKNVRRSLHIRHERNRMRRRAEPSFYAVECIDLPADESPVAVGLMQLEKRHCRWPIGDGENLKFCGANKFESFSYCARHCRMAYRRA